MGLLAIVGTLCLSAYAGLDTTVTMTAMGIESTLAGVGTIMPGKVSTGDI